MESGGFLVRVTAVGVSLGGLLVTALMLGIVSGGCHHAVHAAGLVVVIAVTVQHRRCE